MTKSHKVFGRITATKEECLELIKFFNDDGVLMCYEKADDGCSHDHCHFIAESSNYKNLKALRQSFSDRCFKTLNERLRYSIKEYEEEKDAEAYICKGHKKDAGVKPEIIKNTYGIDVQEAYERFHQLASAIKQSKRTVCIWKEVIKHIEEVDPDVFTNRFTSGTTIRIASHLFDYYVQHERMIQGKYVQQMIIQTIIANKFQDKSLKKSVIQSWTGDLQYWNGLDMSYDQSALDAFEDL